MEADLLSLGFDFYCQSPPRFFDESYEQDLALVDSIMYAPAEAESVTGLYPSYREASSSPDGANSCSTQVASPQSTPPAGAATTKNMVMERDRRRRLNEKLYALRSVVPNITKMDKASIIRDAIAYIEQLQEEERRMLAEVSALESSGDTAAAVKTEDAATGDADSYQWRKRMRMATGEGVPRSIDTSPPVQILEVQVSEAGKKVGVVSVRYSRGRDAVAKVCRALEPLRLRVVTASIAAAGDTVVHTMFVEIFKCSDMLTEEMSGAQLKETIESALAQVDVNRRSLKSQDHELLGGLMPYASLAFQ